jgi:tRNA nucleotidyltransferase (CCA-adding enzyme)
MQKYKVGGAVRDTLLGLAVSDTDWVVVGSTVAEMLEAGFTPVGKDFPVFLHPTTKDEHALARTERKTAAGYNGFVVFAERSVTLREDLSRRDLTMNAMALGEDGELIDPFGGQRDLAAGVMRHVSDAFQEDPVRIFRVARFAARFGFTVAPETMGLMRAMVESGEVDSLVGERVWRELARGLMEPEPQRMLDVLLECGALARVLPEIAALDGVIQPESHHPEVFALEHCRLVLAEAVKANAPLAVRFACLVHDLGKGTTAKELLPRHFGHEKRGQELVRELCARLRVPSDLRGLAAMVAGEHGNVHASMNLNGAAAVRLLERCDAFRQSGRFLDAMLACECDARGRLGMSDRAYPQRSRLEAALRAALATDTQSVAGPLVAKGRKGEEIGAAIHKARAEAVQREFDRLAALAVA